MSQKVNWISYLPFPFCITIYKKNKIFGNVLEFRQQICHGNVLIVLGYWEITLQQSSFPINLNPFYVKIEEPLTEILKPSTLSRPFSSLKCFSWNSFESKDSFCCTDVKIKNFFRRDYEISEMKQKWSTGVEVHVQKRTGRVLYSLPE